MAESQHKSEKQRVGKYILGDKLGEGSFGIVRRARHEESGHEYAIKILDKAQVQLMQMTPQLKREMCLLTTLKHPNIVEGFEILNSKTKLYFVMEFVEGGDLHSLLTARRLLHETEAKRIFSGLIDCLTYCHGNGIYHRDLKLENILISRDGTAKVCDFGLTSIRALNGNADHLCSTMIGTEDFVAPEIIQRLPYDPEKADMWSAGVILFIILAGFCPFRGNDTQALFASIRACRYSFPDKFPQGAKELVSALLVSNPMKRPSALQVRNFHWLSTSTDDEESSDSPRRVQVGGQIVKSTSTMDIDAPDESTRSCSSSTSRQSDANALRHLITQNPALALAAHTIPDFNRIYRLMREANLVKDRRWRLKTYPKTFVGSEMVTWMSQNLQISKEDALKVGEKMLQADVFHHVCRDHCFKDDYLYYRFSVDEPDDSRVLNLRQLWPETLAAREPLVVSKVLLSSLLALLKIHQSLAREGEVGEVDLVGLRSDDSFTSFRMATAELQAVRLEELQTSSASLAFLINIYHILVVHERIHRGNPGTRGRSALRSHLLYIIGTYRLGLNDLEYLLKAHTPESSSYVSQDSGTLISSSVSLAANTFARMVRVTGNVEKLGSSLDINQDDLRAAPLVLSAALPSDPPLRVFESSEVSEYNLLNRTAHYLRGNIVADVERRKVGLPEIMRRFRERYSPQGNRSLLDSIIALFEQFPASREPDVISWQLRVLVRSELNPHVFYLEDDPRFAPVIELPSSF